MKMSKTGFGATVLVLLLSCSSSASMGREYFIDFDKGSDSADGSISAPWKHAPGDAMAAGRPASTGLQAGDTVTFKGGVSYRGTIRITASGTPDKPIIFNGTGFGERKGIIDGSDRLTAVEPCTSEAQCGGYSNWRELVLVHLPPSKLKSTQLYTPSGPIFEAQWPTPSDPFYADNIREWNITPVEDQERIESGRVRAPQIAKALKPTVRPTLLLWVRGNEFARLPITGVDGDDILFDASGAKLYGKVPGRFAIAGNIGKPLPLDRYALLPDGLAVANVPLNSPLSIGVERSGLVLEGASNIQIRGIQFHGQTNDSGTWSQSIAIANIRLPSKNLKITKNTFGPSFLRSGQGMVQLMRATNVVIEDNDFERIVEGSGVRIWMNSSNILISRNRVNYIGRTAFAFLGVSKGVIDGNQITNVQGIHGNAISVYLDNRDISVTNNWVVNTTRPATFHGDRSRTALGDHNILFNRNIFVSTDAGLGALSSWGSETRGVTITRNYLAAPKAGAWLNAEDRRVVLKDNVLTGVIITKGAVGPDWEIGSNKQVAWSAGGKISQAQACRALALPVGTAFGGGTC